MSLITLNIASCSNVNHSSFSINVELNVENFVKPGIFHGLVDFVSLDGAP